MLVPHFILYFFLSYLFSILILYSYYLLFFVISLYYFFIAIFKKWMNVMEPSRPSFC